MNNIKNEINKILNYNQSMYINITSKIENGLLYLQDIEDCKNINIEKVNINNNLYLKDIKFATTKLNNIEITNQIIHKNQLFINNTYNINNLLETPNFGYFTKDISFPVIYKNNIPWMSIVPSEINTMQHHIDKMYGDVLVLGCGLGYIAYMLSLKDNVSKITIIEKDYNVIKMFKDNILPQFKNKDKIEIILNDAINYLAKNNYKYNFIYADLWYNGIDGINFYLKIKPFEIKYESIFYYWIEDEIIQQIRINICENFLKDKLTHNQKIYLKNISKIDDFYKLIEDEEIIKNYLIRCNFIL